MQKLESSLKNMVLVLVGVALVVGAVLAYVNHITSGPIAQKAEQSLAAGIKSVMGTDDLQVAAPEEVPQTIDGKEVTFIVHACSDKSGNSLGAAVESTTGGFGGDLKVLVGFDKEGKILGYTLLQHSETPGLGAKASTWFQKDGKGSIIGKTPKDGNLHVSKDDKSGNAVDAITASTITSRAFLKAINQAYAAYTQQGTDGKSGATKVKKGYATMSNIKILMNGIIKENPTFVLLLGMCPTLATTTSAINGLSMGLATMAVLICTNFVISCIKKITPDMVRIPVFIVVIAAFVTILQMFMSAYAPDSINQALGIYIPLIVVNCIILGRAESFAAKNSPVASLFDGIGVGLGFTLGLTILGCAREILGSGSLFGVTLLPETTNILVFILPPGAFLTLGYIIAIFNKVKK